MEFPPILFQTLGSLLAILAIYGLTRWLGLGGKPILANEETVLIVANGVEDGFVSVRTSISRNGAAALARDSSGRIMLIKRHGNQFSGRILDRRARVREEVDALVIDSGEAQFGSVKLTLKDPGFWTDAINRL